MSLIRLAELKDKIVIQRFINKYWAKNHILSLSDKLFEYMYKNEKSKKYNFLLSFSSDEKVLEGILGFIPTSHFDNSISNSINIVWYTIWQVLEIPNNKLLGIRLIKNLSKLFPESNFGTVGAKLATIPIYKLLKYHTGILENYIYLNPSIRNYQIAKIKYNFNFNFKNNLSKNDNISILDITSKVNEYENDINKAAKYSNQYKNFNYLKNRYFNHPFFYYEIWMLNNVQTISFMIARRIKYKNSSLVKIVDYIGSKEVLSELNTDSHIKILKESEYIEFRSFGLSDQLQSAGFINVTNKRDCIFPGYYDPFLFKNREIYWSLKSIKDNSFIVTGDCDQDRPNRLKEFLI